MKFFNTKWWKFLGMGLILLSLFYGLTVPLGPGIVALSQNETAEGKYLILTVESSGTHFKKYPTKAYLVYKEFKILSKNTESLSNQKIKINFKIPNHIPDSAINKLYHLVLKNNYDGTFLEQSALKIKDINPNSDSAVAHQKEIQKIGFTPAQYFHYPNREVLNETIRNLFYHVPMWFAMIFMTLFSFIFSIKYLNKSKEKDHLLAHSFAVMGIVFGIIGISTGAFWARFTWGTFWTADPKLNGAAAGLLIYLAYFVLSASLKNSSGKGKIKSVYNIFAFPLFIVFIWVLPKLANASLHPGSGDSVGFNNYDLDNNMRMIFYPAVLGWILFGCWISGIIFRIQKIKHWRILNY